VQEPTVKVQVAFYGPLRPIVGGHMLMIDVPRPATLGRLLRAVLERVPDLRPELVDATGQPHRYVHLIVNGRDHPYLPDQLETLLGPQDRVDIFPATAGGSAI
jgi:molybdopterin converting factor small subunit